MLEEAHVLMIPGKRISADAEKASENVLHTSVRGAGQSLRQAGQDEPVQGKVNKLLARPESTPSDFGLLIKILLIQFSGCLGEECPEGITLHWKSGGSRFFQWADKALKPGAGECLRAGEGIWLWAGEVSMRLQKIMICYHE